VKVAVLVLAFVVAGCQQGRDPNPSPPPPPPVKHDAAVPSFSRDIAPVLAKHCTSKDCHGADPATDFTLDMRLGSAYHQLVNVPAEMGTTHIMRVRPGDVDNSMLAHKLTGRLSRKEGKRMPIDDDTGEPAVPSPLPPGFVDLVLAWIAGGAPDN
jgi:hypothetical protein